MAKAKAQSAKDSESESVIDIRYFRSDAAYLCMILNRRTNFVRVIDFRAGPLPAKRLYIQTVSKEEGMAKVITLVEKDEVSSWTKVGFVREGTIPGFYKRSDGHLCGCVIGDRTASVEVSSKIVKSTEKVIVRAKKAAGKIPDRINNATIYAIEEEDALAARDEAWAQGEGLHSFDNFGRDASRMYYETSYKKTTPNFISSEFQDCFGHSLIEVLRSPKDDEEVVALVAGLRTVGDDLTERGIVAGFSFCPYDDQLLSNAFYAAGYRKTGLLAEGIAVGGKRKAAILWTRKLANPHDE